MMPLLFDAREVKWFLGFWSGKHRQAYICTVCMYVSFTAGRRYSSLLMMGMCASDKW